MQSYAVLSPWFLNTLRFAEDLEDVFPHVPLPFILQFSAMPFV